MNLLLLNDEILTVETMKADIPWDQYGINEVFTAYDVKTAKNGIREHPIDLMLCDIEMPGEDGLSMLRWVKENKREIECIFLTCHANFEYAKEAIRLGCQNYIVMPADYEDIGAAVLQAVNEIKEHREALRYQEYGKQIVKERLNQAEEKFGQDNMESRVDAAIGYILRNLGSESLSVNEIADKCFVHPVYLNRIFNKEKGISVGQYIIRERMKVAADLLKSKQLSANTVADLVGYKSYPNFNLMFKKYYGCSPTQYQD